jgi:hypothetical protein
MASLFRHENITSNPIGNEDYAAGLLIDNSHQKKIALMFNRARYMQYPARPAAPDPLYAKKLQELIGGQWGEMSVMMTYLFQGWNCRAPAKYRDMILDIGLPAHVR